jgi:DNA-binding PucR family transcriptional regulator
VSARWRTAALGHWPGLTDDEKKPVLDTFRAWLDNNGSVPDTGAAPFCHPNTVRYRLRRIEDGH